MSRYWEGEKIRLRAVEPEDAAVHFDLNKYTRTMRMLDMVYPPSSKAGVNDWAARTSASKFENDEYTFQIESRESCALVGGINTHDCNRRVGTFRYGIHVIPEHEGNGYASEAIRLILRYFFDELRYQKCDVQVFAINDASIHLHEKLGFILEGRQRRAVYTDGEFSDLLLYGITVDEFRERP